MMFKWSFPVLEKKRINQNLNVMEILCAMYIAFLYKKPNFIINKLFQSL